MIKSGHINMKLTLFKKSFTSFLLVSMSMFSANSFGYTLKDLQGIWAMHPLNNGIANLVEFSGNTATLHPVQCDFETGLYTVDSIEKSNFKINKQNQIELYNEQGEFEQALRIISITNNQLVLEEAASDTIMLKFHYNKINKLTQIVLNIKNNIFKSLVLIG